MYKVLALVTFRVYPTLMGGQKGVALFYQYLSRHAKVVMAASDDNIAESPTVLNNLYSNKLIIFNIFKLRWLKKLVTSENPDLIIAEHSYPGLFAILLHKTTGKPFIIHSHNLEYKRFREMGRWWWKWYFKYEKWVHKKAGHSFFISEDDRSEAIALFKLDQASTSVITYGVEIENSLTRAKARTILGLDPDETILLFNGTLDYKPNNDAVITIIDKLNPVLRKHLKNYKFVITGNRASTELKARLRNEDNIQYKGYVEKIDLYYQSANLFVNPVINNTGVKTKVIEAVANNCTTISTKAGAAGIDINVCGDKLKIVPNDDWDEFAQHIITFYNCNEQKTPEIFYENYSWINIVSKADIEIKKIIEA